MLLVNLPDVILKHLQSFLSSDDLHYFLNCNKQHFSSLKEEMIYFSLNQEKSREYVENESFRDMLLSKVKDGSQQIGLTFDREYEVPNIRDISAHKIVFDQLSPHFPKKICSVCCVTHEATEIPFLPMLQDLTLYNCQSIKTFQTLSHLRRLELQTASLLTDITPLQNIPHLTFTYCPNIQDFSVLSNKRQQFVSIIQSAISDVSSLCHIETVRLRLCSNLVDVSPLHGVRNLLITQCNGVRDISCLGNHHCLTITHCRSVERGFECFRTVRHAEVLGSEVSDLNVFREAKSLRMTYFSAMESQLYLLKDIPDLSLVSGINVVKGVYDISHLRNSRLSFQHDSIKFNYSILPSQLLYLSLERCDQIVKIIDEGRTSIFHHLQSLHLTSCLIEHVNGLGDVPTLVLERCPELHDITGLGRNRCVELSGCPKICDVSSLTPVLIVKISRCKGITDYTCLSLIPRLKII